jgi:hypothetical protein
VWDSQANKEHYIKRTGQPGKILENNVKNVALVNSEEVLLLPLQIKLGLVKNCVKVFDISGEGFLYLRSKF